MKETRSYEEIRDYLHCPMLYYWKHIALSDQEIKISALDLPKRALLQALPIYFDGENSKYDLAQWVDFVWTTWLKQIGKGQDDLIKGFQGYHSVRYNEVLKPFLTGEARGRGGKKFVEPRASKAYKERYQYFDLGSIEDQLGKIATSLMGVEEAEVAYPNLGKYSVAQAYSDSLVMAMNFKPPAPSAVWGAGRSVQVRLNDHVALDAVVDLITIERGKSQVYFLDARPMFFFDKSFVWKRPELIAAGLFEASEGDTPFPSIETIIYVHLYSGEVMKRKVVSASRLQNIFLMASRGISANIFIPAFLSDDHTKCRACALRSRCYDREDALESLFPGAYQTAGALEFAARNPEAYKLPAALTEFDLKEIAENTEDY
jgi:hypothetical protein